MITLTNSGWNSGLREWVLQRFTALYMSVYILFLVFYFCLFNGVDYNNWFNLFNSFYFKIFTILFVFSLVLHASIGMCIVLTDYIKNSFLRVFLDFMINLILLSYIFCIMQILWGFK
ncbi:MAG TPA: succinate dehydrogenase, hydrophobic membrane anchor protein [Candidatus Azoamicus sp.]